MARGGPVGLGRDLGRPSVNADAAIRPGAVGHDVHLPVGPSPTAEAGLGAGDRGAGAGPTRGGRRGALALVAGLALVGGLGFRRVFDGHDLQVIIPVAALVPVILVGVLGGRRRRLPLAVTVAAWGVGFVVWAAATVASSAGGVPGRLGLVRTGALTGWSRLLDTAVPAPAEAGLLLFPAALTWLAAALSAELVMRTRTRLLPVLPVAVLFTIAMAYRAPGAGADLPLAGTFAALAAALLRLRRGGRPAPPSTATWLASATRSACAVAVVVAVGAGLAGGPLRASGHRPPADPRTLRTTAATAVPELNPLSRLAGWTAHPDQTLFRVRLTPARPGPAAMRLAVLDSYDGADWTSTARYLPAGHAVSLPPAGDPSAPAPFAAGDDRSTPVTQDLTIAGLAGRLVPALAQLGQFSLPSAATSGGFAVAAGDGTLLRTSPLRADDSVRLVSTPPVDLSAEQLLALTVSRPTDNARYLALPADLPPVLRGLAVVATAGGTSPYQRAALLRQYLMATFVFDPTVPAGHSLAHVSHFLEQTRRGTSEQFATAFVLAARLLGLPTRLVVGFTASGTGNEPRTVRGADALAWAEVDFVGAGWLPFFPTPRAGDARGAAVAGSTQGESPAQTSLVNAVLSAAAPSDRAGTAQTGDPATTPHGPRPEPSDWPSGARWAATGTGMTLACYLLVAWAVPGLRRRRSRHRGDGRSRTVAAWRQAIDLVEDVGSPVSPAASPSEVVAAAVGLVDDAGGTALRGLADLATLALFGAAPAQWGAAGGRRAADEAWRQLGALERALRRAVPRHRRLVHRIAPYTVAVEIHRWRRDFPSRQRERELTCGAQTRSRRFPWASAGTPPRGRAVR